MLLPHSKRPSWQFRLRSLLVLVTVAAICSGWLGMRLPNLQQLGLDRP